MEVLKTEFQIVTLDEEKSILTFKWLPTTAEIDEEQFIEEIQKAAEIIKKYPNNNIFVDTTELQFIIGPQLQEKINEILVPVYNNSGVKKVAVLVPDEFYISLPVEEVVKQERAKHKFISITFHEKDRQKAIDWLLGKFKL